MEKTKNKSGGRKQNSEISTNDMLLWIDKYTKEFPNEEINISKLAKYSNIKRHYWYYRNGIMERIDKINNISYEDYEISCNNDKKMLEIPDVDTLIENNYRNKAKLKAIISHYFDIIQEFYDSALKLYALEKEHRKLKKENEKLKAIIAKNESTVNDYKSKADYYKNQLRTITVRSGETAFRKENNIEDNVINITKNKKVVLTTNSNELEKMLDNLGK